MIGPAEAPAGNRLILVCTNENANAAFHRGYEAQSHMRVDEALDAYALCLKLQPDCLPCRYETGWSHWSIRRWSEAAAAWAVLLQMAPDHEQARVWRAHALSRAAAEKERSGGTTASAAP